jgi:hypothetical protein
MKRVKNEKQIKQKRTEPMPVLKPLFDYTNLLFVQVFNFASDFRPCFGLLFRIV